MKLIRKKNFLWDLDLINPAPSSKARDSNVPKKKLKSRRSVLHFAFVCLQEQVEENKNLYTYIRDNVKINIESWKNNKYKENEQEQYNNEEKKIK